MKQKDKKITYYCSAKVYRDDQLSDRVFYIDAIDKDEAANTAIQKFKDEGIIVSRERLTCERASVKEFKNKVGKWIARNSWVICILSLLWIVIAIGLIALWFFFVGEVIVPAFLNLADFLINSIEGTKVEYFLDFVVKVSFVVGAYFTPAIIAFKRKHQNALAIFWLNLFSGWTVIGWIASIIWSGTAVMKEKD